MPAKIWPRSFIVEFDYDFAVSFFVPDDTDFAVFSIVFVTRALLSKPLSVVARSFSRSHGVPAHSGSPALRALQLDGAHPAMGLMLNREGPPLTGRLHT